LREGEAWGSLERGGGVATAVTGRRLDLIENGFKDLVRSFDKLCTARLGKRESGDLRFPSMVVCRRALCRIAGYQKAPTLKPFIFGDTVQSLIQGYTGFTRQQLGLMSESVNRRR
jgi:hypothetical protein